MALNRGLFKSAEAEAAPAERRRSVRHVTVFQVAKLSTSSGEELCLLRDVSDDGLKAEVYSRVVEGETVTVELRTGHSVVGKVMWIEKPMIGIKFLDAVPILSMLAHCAFDDRMSRVRPPRIDVDLPAVLTTWDEVLDVRVINMSQAGMRIQVGKPVSAEEMCDIALPGLPKRDVRVRWSHHGDCGLLLDQPLTYRDFAAWRTQLHATIDPAGPAAG